MLSDLQGFSPSRDIAAPGAPPRKKNKWNLMLQLDDEVRDEDETDISGF